jgi:hypothetical protein
MFFPIFQYSGMSNNQKTGIFYLDFHIVTALHSIKKNTKKKSYDQKIKVSCLFLTRFKREMM